MASAENNNGQRSVVVVDDDPIVAALQGKILESAGYAVKVMTDSEKAAEDIPEMVPDAVLIDLMMPKLDGYGLIKRLAAAPELEKTRLIVVSAKPYEFDRKQAFEHGAHGFITKNVEKDELIAEVGRLIENRVHVDFWGVRGTLPRPGEDSIRYGGNTNCVSMTFPRGQMFIFDAGSGIKQLSNYILSQGKKSISARIFISHPHWDHINSLPFFVPLYMQGNEFEIIGARHGALSMREIASAQMDGVYFPITLKEFAARVYFRDISEEKIEVDGVTVETMMLSHPGICLGYKMTYDDRVVCYITDNEMFLDDAPQFDASYEKKLAAFIEGCDILITDSTYTDDEYKTKVGWGHSCLSKVAQLAATANVKKLCLYHHDPDQNDEAIDRKLEITRDMLKDLNPDVICEAPAEGDRVTI